MYYFTLMVTSHVIGTDLPTILHFACIFGNTVGSFSCTRALRGRVQGAIVLREIMA